MGKRTATLPAAILGLLLLSMPLLAHHGSAAFDMGRKVTMKGTVTEWVWANPHCFLKYDVADANGSVVHWVAETSNPPDMINSGWSKQSLSPGDQITITVEPVKNGRPAGHLLEVILPNGKTLSAWGGVNRKAIPGNGF